MTFTAPERWAQPVLLLTMAAGCWLVLAPFLPAILFSVAIALSTWPAHARLLQRLRGRRLAASIASWLIVTTVVLVPAALLMLSFRDAASWLLGLIDEWRSGAGHGVLPQWLTHIPVVGDHVQRVWRDGMLDEPATRDLIAALAEPAQRMALATGKAVGSGLLQAMVAAVLLFFLYRDGDRLAHRVAAAAERIGGAYARELLDRARDTVSGIMLSVVGAALAQATLATIGFYLAGVPNPFLLGTLTFALSLVPVGPPLIWGASALWLLQQSRPGWAVFMALYGLFGISSVDNVLKPLLISRTSRLPFALTLMGVIGGAFAFGIAGVFLGPVLLALSIEVLRHVDADQCRG